MFVREAVGEIMLKALGIHFGFASAFDHAGDAHAAKWLGALIDEYVIRFAPLLGNGAPQLA
jgi:hypothetical protein